MKRVQYDRYGGPETMYVGDFAVPPVGAKEVRVSVKAAAVNSLDWKLRQGVMKMMIGGGFPKGMGNDFAGVVEAVGGKVKTVRVGEEVFGSLDIKKSGAFAEAVVVDAANLTQKPAKLSFQEAACLPIPAMTAWVALLDVAKAKAGSRIFVNGCSGAVGAFAVRLAVAKGAHVSGACGPTSVAIAEAAGAEQVFGYGNAARYAQKGKFDIVFDTLGTLGVGAGLAILKPKGVFVDINPSLGRVLRGMLSGRYKLAFGNAGYKFLPEIAKLAGEGLFPPTIGLEASLADAPKAIEKAEAGAVRGKTVLVF